MNINRHNYEEYFLLYVDNELSVEQKKQVDLFVKENVDLEEELVMLQQSRLIPDKIVFKEKYLLMREENNSFINLNNYEEWLVLYVDNELNNEEKLEVEKFAAAHSHVGQELALFQQTKLYPDEEIVFADKKVLHRTENVRVISMRWWRVAVAAVLIVAAGVTVFSVLNRGNNNGVVTTEELARGQKKQSPEPVKPVAPDTQVQNKRDHDNSEQSKIAISGTAVNGNNKSNRSKLRPTKQTSDNKQFIVGNKYQRPRLTIIEDGIARNASKINEVTDGAGKDDVTDLKRKLKASTIIDAPVTSKPANTPIDVASNAENKKLRGFFRKATRIIERTTNINPADDDNRVLIGGMAINLK